MHQGIIAKRCMRVVFIRLLEKGAGGGERADDDAQGRRDSGASLSLQPYQFVDTTN